MNNDEEEGKGGEKEKLLSQAGQYGSTTAVTEDTIRQSSGESTGASGTSTSDAPAITFVENEDHTIRTTEIYPVSEECSLDGAFDEEDDENEEEEDDSYYDDNDDESEIRSRKGFHLGRPGLITNANLWTSMRLTESFMEYGDEYDIVPSLHRDNLALVLDPNLSPRDNGSLYYAQQAFYRSDEEPEYVITVNASIYQRIVKEISDSRSVPCGLYYFCHEGDSARTGASKDDHVDIRLAWAFLTAVFAGMLLLSVFEPY